MRSNLLKLNQDKTELIIFAPRHRLKEFEKHQLTLDGTIVSDATCVKNLSIQLVKSLSMEQHISAASKLCFFKSERLAKFVVTLRTVLAKL